jgi:acyl dehydratase
VGTDSESRMLTAEGCGSMLGPLLPFTISQQEEDAFAALIGDWDPMHNDAAWQLDSQWGGPIVLGFHVLARIESLMRGYGVPPGGVDNETFVTTGLNRVRFTSPLPVGTEARAEVILESVDEQQDHATVRTTCRTWVVGADRPTMVAEHLGVLCRTEVYADVMANVNADPPPIAEIPPGSPVAEAAVHDGDFYDSMHTRAGEWLGCGPWTVISEREADAFAVLTGGLPAYRRSRSAAARTDSRGLVDPLHLLALRAYFMPGVGLPVLSDSRMAAFNYGIDRARWYGTVPVGCELRDHVRLLTVTTKAPGRYLVSTRHIVEASGHSHAVLSADCLTLFVVHE